MLNNSLIKELGYTELHSAKEYSEFSEFNIDAIHFSGEFPTVIFKSVSGFTEDNLKVISEIHKKIWNYSKVVFLFVSSPFEVRIYNCNYYPFNYKAENVDVKEELAKREIVSSLNDEKDKIQELENIFSAVAIDSGLIWSIENEFAEKIALQNKVDKYLVRSLLKTAEILKRKGLNEDIIHSLLMRSLFIMYLQDKKAIPEDLWKKIGEIDYLNILESEKKTYELFDIIEHHFNGNVFPLIGNERKIVNKSHLKVIKDCLTDGEIEIDQTKLFEWRIFDFNIIRIELLSEIYENFLNELDPKLKKKKGQFYTPPPLVELILKEVLPYEGTDYNKKIIDPACGSGIFLVEAFKRLVKRWKNAHERTPSFSELVELLQKTIFGVEIDKRAIRVAAFSLYLTILDFLEPKNVWYSVAKTKFPYLIHEENSDKIGNNLFLADTIEDDGLFEKIEYDVVIGNPPFGKSGLPINIYNYCEKYNFSKQYVIPFIHKAAKLSKNGKVALIFNTKILTNSESPAQNFRKWLFKNNYVEKVYNLSILRNAPKNFGGRLFNSASVPVSIVFFQSKMPEKNKPTIQYWAPKTYIKSHVAEGIIIDSTDIKFLPRYICEEPTSKIWKIAQWGSLMDYFLIKKRSTESLKEYFDKNNYSYGVGLELSEPLDKKDYEIKDIPHINLNILDRYYTKRDNVTKLKNTIFRRLGCKEAYKSPHLLFKEGIVVRENYNGEKELSIVASYCDYDCSYYKGIVGIHSMNSNDLKILTAYINSKFCKYFLFMSGTSWGIERDTFKYNELFEIPNILAENIKNKDELLKLAEQVVSIRKNELLDSNIESIEEKINETIYKMMDLGENEISLIEDSVRIMIDLFHKGEKSYALKPTNTMRTEAELYSKMLCKELNENIKFGGLKTTAIAYNVTQCTPLSMVVVKFIEKNNNVPIEISDSDNEFQKILKKINLFTIKEYSRNIYVQKQIRYYDDNKIFIIKPNQKRFWTRSQGIDDAHSIITEISNLE